MKLPTLLLFGLLLGGQIFAQSGAVIPQGGAGYTAQASCIILKRMGPADEVTSHALSIKKSGFKDWTKNIKISAGSTIHIKPDLEKVGNQ